MSASFGIHFGTTTVSLAVCKDGKADVVANDAGDRVTPALVAFLEADKTVGLAAKQGLIRNASNTVQHIKSLIGRNFDHPIVQALLNNTSVKIVNDNGKPAYEITHKEKKRVVQVTEVAKCLLQCLRGIAESHSDSDTKLRTVVAVPVCFDEAQRGAINDVAQLAGFSVLRVISEPASALLAYKLGQAGSDDNGNVLVLRIGGSSMDVNVLSVTSGLYRHLATASQCLGGEQITQLLMQFATADFQRQWKMNCSSDQRAQAKLRMACELCKHVLSTRDSATCAVDSLHEGMDFNCTVSRARFEGLISPHVQALLQPINTCLSNAAMKPADIDKVVLSGGSVRIPLINRQVVQMFPNADILTSLAPDQVIAVGCALQASILQGYSQEELLCNEDKTSVPSIAQDLCIMVEESGKKKVMPLLKRGTPVPAKTNMSLKLAEGQSSACVRVVEANDDEEETTLLGVLVMSTVPAAAELSVTMHMKSDGSLHVHCKELQSGTQEELHLAATPGS